MRVYRSIDEPIRQNLTWEEKWSGPDRGLIIAWEVGRKEALADGDLESRAINGELVPFGWKGGVREKLKKEKYGCLFYLAAWQGLRSQALDIETEDEIALTCTRTDMTVIFTNDAEKYGEP
jgi:hypothetical protein